MSGRHRPDAPGRALGWVHALNPLPGYGNGTLAAVLRPTGHPGVLYGLTAGHVVSEDDRARAGNPCVLRSAAGAVAGQLHDWDPWFGADARRVSRDCGLISFPAEALEPLVDDLDWPLGWADPRPGERLRVLTRHHRLPASMVRMEPVVPMQAGVGNHRYDLLDAALFDAGAPLQGGDSGAALWNDEDQIVGVLCGFAPPDAGATAVMTPIRRILEWADAELVLRHEGLRADDRAAPRPGLPSAAPAALATTPSSAVVQTETAWTLARTLWGEARGDGRAGMSAVGHVVLNRVIAESWWGRDIEAVCRKPFQFSCWNANDPNLPQMLRVTTADPAFAIALELAAGFAHRLANDPARVRGDPTLGATHYFSKRLARWPDWAVGRQPVAQIGDHLFFKGIR